MLFLFLLKFEHAVVIVFKKKVFLAFYLCANAKVACGDCHHYL